jgi:hypothetical protein
MIKRITIVAALAAFTSVAHADTRVGLELGRTLAGVDGPGVRVSFGGVELEAVVAGYAADTTPEVHGITGELRALVPLRRFDDGWIGVEGGVAIAHDVETLPDDRVSGWRTELEAGLHAEWFPVENLSLGFDVGVTHTRPRGPEQVPRDELGRAAGGATLTYWLGGNDAPATDRPARFGLGAIAGTEAPGLTADLDLGRFLVEGTVYGTRETIGGTRYGWTLASIAGYAELARRGPVALLGGLRVSAMRPVPSDTVVGGITPIVAAPLRIRYDVTRWLTLHAETAIELIRITPGIAPIGAQTIPPASLDAGFTVWF